jgi:hypothetical protein
MGVHFLWTKINNLACICDSLFFGDAGDFVVSHHKNGVYPFLPCFLIALSHAAKILSKRRLPHFSCCWVFHQPFVAADSLTCDRVYHRHCNLLIVKAHWH